VRELVALVGDDEVGRLRRRDDGSAEFTYDDQWRHAADSFPVSVSWPLVRRTHAGPAVEAFLLGLLPDNAAVLGQWARRFQVSANDPFSLLAHVGEDCAGAVQFVRPERVAEIRGQSGPRIERVTEAEIGRRLAALRRDQSAWRSPNDSGQFSLGGAQPKTALILLDGKWGVPAGRTPTTHILKPPIDGLDGHAENEHYCLTLARAVGLPAASSAVRFFANEPAIVVERYDRIHSTRKDEREPVRRVHQEDVCQALGCPPARRYQSDGGPSPAQIIDLIRVRSDQPREDLATFLDALALSWVIGGTDAHAKNFSLLHGRGSRLRLAPLYDAASALPHLAEQKLKLAMKIGDHYGLRAILRGSWSSLARENGLPVDEVLSRVRRVAVDVPEAAQAARARLRDEGLEHPVIERLTRLATARARRCAAIL
jgi:serine/threonine-protein kinase HipA